MSSQSQVVEQKSQHVEPFEPQGFANLVHDDDRHSLPQETGPNQTDFGMNLGMAPDLSGQPSYHLSRPYHNNLTSNQPTFLNNNFASLAPSTQTQGLSSLVEAAALAPSVPENGAYDILFTPVPAGDFDPAMWEGFMLPNENPNEYMGTYDADISWAFDRDLSPQNFLNYDYESSVMADPYTEEEYQDQILPLGQIVPKEPVDSEEEEDSNDWPDKPSRNPIPMRSAPRIIPVRRSVDWRPIQDEARTSILLLDKLTPMQRMNDTLRASIIAALDVVFEPKPGQPDISEFPPSDVLDYFFRLYVHHVQPRFPVLHLPTFSMYSTPPLLLACMMFLGSSHSKIDGGSFLRLFYDYARRASFRTVEIDHKMVSPLRIFFPKYLQYIVPKCRRYLCYFPTLPIGRLEWQQEAVRDLRSKPRCSCSYVQESSSLRL